MNKRRLGQKYLQKRLFIQVLIFAVASAVVFSLVGYDVVLGIIGLGLAILGIAIGIVAGFIARRMYILQWREDKRRVIIGRDKTRTSIILIIAFIGFRLVIKEIFSDFLYGTMLTAFTFSSIGGLMLGRLLNIMRDIRRVLRQQKIL